MGNPLSACFIPKLCTEFVPYAMMPADLLVQVSSWMGSRQSVDAAVGSDG